MDKILLIFITFIVFSFISLLLGKKLLSLMNFNCDVLALPFGYFAYFAIFQILVYPLQLLKLNTSLLPILIVVLCLAVLVLCFKEIKNIKLNKFAIIYTVIMFVVFMFMYYNKLELLQGNLTLNDAIYYDTQINYYTRPNTMINQTMPIFGNFTLGINVIYAFLGGGCFLGGLARLINIEPLLIINWFLPMLYWMLMTTCAYNIYALVKKYFDNKKMALVLLVVETIMILSDSSILYSSYITSIRQFSAFSFCLLLLILYVKTKEKPFIYWFIITNFALISFHSTQVFLMGFYLVSFVVYEVIKNEVDLRTTILLAIPDLVYVFFFVLYKQLTITTLLALLALGVFIFYLYKKNFQLNNRVLLILLIIGAVAINASWFYLGNQIATDDGHSTLYVFEQLFLSSFDLITVLYYLYAIVIVVCLIKFKELNETTKFVVINALTIFVFFFNPFSASFVTKYILSFVYYRTMYVYFDVLFLVLLLFDTKSSQKLIQAGKALVIAVFALYLISVGVTSAMTTYTDLNKKNELIENIDPIYKVGYESIQLGNAIDSAIDAYQVDGYITMPRFVLNTVFVSNKYHFSNLMQGLGELRLSTLTFEAAHYDEMNDRTKLEVMLQDPSMFFTDWYYTYEPDSVPDIESIMVNSNTDFFIIKKLEEGDNTYFRFNEILASFATKVAESENYDIYYIPR